jgi:hypothetical protein
MEKEMWLRRLPVTFKIAAIEVCIFFFLLKEE